MIDELQEKMSPFIDIYSSNKTKIIFRDGTSVRTSDQMKVLTKFGKYTKLGLSSLSPRH